MKTALVGFEFGFSATTNSFRVSFPIVSPITLRAYQFDMAMRPMGGTPVPAEWATDVYFQARLGNPAGNGDFGAVQHDPGVVAYDAEGALFCAAILKTWGSAPVNKVITLSDLNIPVSANTPLIFNCYLSGTPFDFEVAGILHYDNQ